MEAKRKKNILRNVNGARDRWSQFNFPNDNNNYGGANDHRIAFFLKFYSPKMLISQETCNNKIFHACESKNVLVSYLVRDS